MSSHQPAIIAAFDDRRAALDAVKDMERAGISRDDIGFVVRGEDVARGGMLTDADGAKDRNGALTGMATGATLGGILAAAAAVLVPGVGPVLAGGILSAGIGGAVAGTAIGGLIGAMAGLGVSEEEAAYYQSQFDNGKAIVAVRNGGSAAQAAQSLNIFRRHGGYDIRTAPTPPMQTEGVFSQP